MEDEELNSLEVIQVNPDQVGTALAVIKEVAEWAASRGLTSWQAQDLERTLIPAAGRGELYLVKKDGQAAATFILQWVDKVFWGDAPEDAGYIHKLAVKRNFAGHGLGKYILSWAETKVAAIGRQYLRLDCQANNLKINSYYQEAGFTYRGTLTSSDWNLYEKEVSSPRTLPERN